ncbi:MAG: hypothetical protein NC413_10135 [Muribaculum sp.]|nr:hypothetical protein [Muribaculum sp.]
MVLMGIRPFLALNMYLLYHITCTIGVEQFVTMFASVSHLSFKPKIARGAAGED